MPPARPKMPWQVASRPESVVGYQVERRSLLPAAPEASFAEAEALGGDQPDGRRHEAGKATHPEADAGRAGGDDPSDDRAAHRGRAHEGDSPKGHHPTSH